MPDRSPYSVKTLLLYLADLERREQTARELPDGGGDLCDANENPEFLIPAGIAVSRRELRASPDVQRILRDCEAARFTFDAAGLNRWVALVCKAHRKLPDDVADWNLDAFCELADLRIGPTLEDATNRIFNPDISDAISDADAAVYRPGGASAGATVAKKKAKRSTERGEGPAKLIAALTKHHKYADDGCLNVEPVGNNELARLAGVDQATASAFFKQQFKGHSKYKALCADAARLTAALKLLNGEFAPHLLYGSKPPDEDVPDAK